MVGKTFDCLTKNHFLSQRGSAFTDLISSTVVTSRRCHRVQNAGIQWQKWISKKKISECLNSFSFSVHNQRNYMLPHFVYRNDVFLYLPHRIHSNIVLALPSRRLGVNCECGSSTWSKCWFGGLRTVAGGGLFPLPWDCHGISSVMGAECCRSKKIASKSLQPQPACVSYSKL